MIKVIKGAVSSRRRRLVYILIGILGLTLIVCSVVQFITYSTFKSRLKLEPWEKNGLLNVTNFSWLMNNETMCYQQDPNIQLMTIIVFSARHYFQTRMTIRNSWGSILSYKNWDVRLVFLLGEENSEKMKPETLQKIEESLIEEHLKYGDIIMGSFVDSYRNLTYKHIMGYKWILNYCPNAKFVWKTDDDIFVDIWKWLDWRNFHLDQIGTNNSIKIPDLCCHPQNLAKPQRNATQKWFVPEADWPYEYYPKYCLGWSYGITVNLIKKLYSVSNDMRFFWIDDVFVTGSLLEIVNKKFLEKPKIKYLFGNITWYPEIYREFCDKGAWEMDRTFRAISKINRGKLFRNDMMCLWNKTLYDFNHGHKTNVMV